MSSQSPGSPIRDSFGCGCRRATQRILYGGMWWLPPSPSRGESSEFVLPVACPNTKSVFEGELTNLWLILMLDRVTK
jgi:hypothetical protein